MKEKSFPYLSQMKHFKFYSKPDLLWLTKPRKYETRIGERIQVLNNHSEELFQNIQQQKARFVLVGIPEDIGVRGNLGIGGTDTSWLPFLQSFLNIQNNAYLLGEDILLLGHFDFGDIKYLIENAAYNQDEMVDAFRRAVPIIDDEIEFIAKQITYAGKIPIFIGGGHNNAYPIIKGVAKGLYRREQVSLAQINCINLDAHTDYKFTEGRHSGNPFRYAEHDGYLGKYCAIAVHENYIQQNVLSDLEENPFTQYISFEDIFIREKINFKQAINHAIRFTKDSFIGLELDVDVIENVLSSAFTPTGISTIDARRFIHHTATAARVAYLHICESASQLVTGKRDDSTGKLLSYLVSDFCKAIAHP